MIIQDDRSKLIKSISGLIQSGWKGFILDLRLPLKKFQSLWWRVPATDLGNPHNYGAISCSVSYWSVFLTELISVIEIISSSNLFSDHPSTRSITPKRCSPSSTVPWLANSTSFCWAPHPLSWTYLKATYFAPQSISTNWESPIFPIAASEWQ